MARTPIRDVIDRALEKGVGLENLVAVPMLFNAADQAEKESGMLKTEGGLYVPIDHVSVRAGLVPRKEHRDRAFQWHERVNRDSAAHTKNEDEG
jgi:hypothetical protein